MINKVMTTSGEVLIDLTGDTVTPESLLAGVTAHSRSGEVITGTMESGGGSSQPSDSFVLASGSATGEYYFNLLDTQSTIFNAFAEGLTSTDYIHVITNIGVLLITPMRLDGGTPYDGTVCGLFIPKDSPNSLLEIYAGNSINLGTTEDILCSDVVVYAYNRSIRAYVPDLNFKDTQVYTQIVNEIKTLFKSDPNDVPQLCFLEEGMIYTWNDSLTIPETAMEETNVPFLLVNYYSGSTPEGNGITVSIAQSGNLEMWYSMYNYDSDEYKAVKVYDNGWIASSDSSIPEESRNIYYQAIETMGSPRVSKAFYDFITANATKTPL